MSTEGELPGQLDLPIGDTPKADALRGIVGLISPAELARAIGVAEQTLAGWRCTGKGPSFVKLGKGVFYRLDDVQAWISRSVTDVVAGGSEPA
jgi:hypothetical protein